MHDSLQFILESPQDNLNARKRPRLVTSCDNCRLKKIKCLQASPDAKCKACNQAKVSCRFRDRERYFAERSQFIGRPPSPATCRGDLKNRSSHNQPRHDLMINVDTMLFGVTSSPPSNFNSFDQLQNLSPSAVDFMDDFFQFDPSHCPFDPPASFQTSNNTTHLINQQDSYFSLFDLNQPQYPHSALMPHFIEVFIQNLGAQFPFVTYADTVERLTNGKLPPLLSNSIASLAVRFSHFPELVARGVENAATAYLESAKSMLSTVMHIPSVETLHALMLLSWSNYKSGHISEFCMFCEIAMRMALDLGLSAENTLRLNVNERGRKLLLVTWSSVVQLNLFASTYARGASYQTPDQAAFPTTTFPAKFRRPDYIQP